MKINISLLVSAVSTLFGFSAFTCHALPILANFAGLTNREPAQPSKATIDIYGSELLSPDDHTLLPSHAYYLDSTTFPTPSSGFLLLPNSATSLVQPLSPSRQTVFLDIQGSTVRLDEDDGCFTPTILPTLQSSTSTLSSWFSPLRKREEKTGALPSKFGRIGGLAKTAMITPTSSLHYNVLHIRTEKTDEQEEPHDSGYHFFKRDNTGNEDHKEDLIEGQVKTSPDQEKLFPVLDKFSMSILQEIEARLLAKLEHVRQAKQLLLLDKSLSTDSTSLAPATEIKGGSEKDIKASTPDEHLSDSPMRQ